MSSKNNHNYYFIFLLYKNPSHQRSLILFQFIMEQHNENWMPLESNPEVINTYISKMGLRTQLFSFAELLSTEEWALQMIPKPCIGILLLYEQSPSQNAFKEAESANLNPTDVPPNVFFMKQQAMNACGTIGLFHIILNALQKYPELITQESFLDKFRIKSQGKNFEQRAEVFKNSKEILTQHKQAVNEGVSSVQRQCNSHFIAFVPKNGRIYELDGFKKCPVDHGVCSQEQFLTRGAQQIRKFMERDPDNINFSTIVLCSTVVE